MITTTNTNHLFSRAQKLADEFRRHQLTGSFESIPSRKRVTIIKDCYRYLKKFIVTEHALSKAATIAGLSLFLSTEGQTQCLHYANAAISNPLNITSLSFQLLRSLFVDIDHNGDLHCYGMAVDPNEKVRFAFDRHLVAGLLFQNANFSQASIFY